MSETPPRFDIYGSLPQGLVPRGLIPAAAAAYVGLPLEGFLQAVEEGQFSPPTLPQGNFDQRSLDRDLDRLSSIERPALIAPLASVGPATQTGGTAPIGPVIGAVPPGTVMDAWRSYFPAQIDHLVVVMADEEIGDVDGDGDGEAPDPAPLAAFGRNLGWFTDHWKKTAHFRTKLALSTQDEYARHLSRIAIEFGRMPLVVLDDPEIAADLDEWASVIEETSGPREADLRLSVLSSAVTWAIRSRDVPEIRHNWVKGFRRRHSVDRSGLIYTDDEVLRLMAAADPPVATAILIGSETALRVSDVLGLGWDQYDGDLLTVVHGKQRTGRPKRTLRIPCSARLKTHLDGLPRVGDTIVATNTGGRWDRRRFSREFRDLCQKTEILGGRHFHDFRGTAITRYGELGMTAEMISAITGHSIKAVVQILERYMARTEKMARVVIASVDASRVIDVTKKAG